MNFVRGKQAYKRALLLPILLIAGFTACSRVEPVSESPALSTAADMRFILSLSPSNISTKPGIRHTITATLTSRTDPRKGTPSVNMELRAALPSGVKLKPALPVILAGTKAITFTLEVGYLAKAGSYRIPFWASGTGDTAGPFTATLNLTINGESRLRQFGTPADDLNTGIATDSSGKVYVAGFTGGALSGSSSGRSDGFVRQYNVDGSLGWTRQFGSSGNDYVNGIALAADDTIYVVGETTSVLPGQTSSGGTDAFVQQIKPDGSLGWTRQFGSPDNDTGRGIAVAASGTIYIVGDTANTLPGQTSSGEQDAFVQEIKPDGSLGWTHQFGSTAADFAAGVTASPGGNIYMSGTTSGTLPGQTAKGAQDTFVQEIKPDGSPGWTQQFGSMYIDIASGITASTKGIYVIGNTNGIMPGESSKGALDAFVQEIKPDSTLGWVRQFGGSDNDLVYGIALSPNGNLYVAGETNSTLTDDLNEGASDAFIREYTPTGSEGRTRQLGSSEFDLASSITVDSSNTIHTAGFTAGTLPEQTSSNGWDGFVVFNVFP